jgi:hypothetical protein
MRDNHGASKFWAITSFFNPTHSIRRLANYERFREELKLPLITVEWSYARGPDFMLGPKQAEILVKRKSDDLLWQKERLLNIAIDALPRHCEYVAWLDCDVIFDNPHWDQLAIEQLKEFPLIQPYSALISLEANGELPYNLREHIRRPIGNPEVYSALPNGSLRHQFNGKGPACGYAWAAQTELIRKHGLYDACILGSGDRAIFCAATGQFEEAAAYLRMNNQRYSHYLNWAKPFFNDVAGRIGWIDGRIQNMWHGTMANRQYESRHIKLQKYQFTPDTDLKKDEQECWRWSSPKHEMHKFVRDYFYSRKEDCHTGD